MLHVLKILADSTRLRLLRVLRQGDFTVQDLTQILHMGQSRISRHLLLMSDAGLLKVEKQGTWHYYRLAPDNESFRKIWPAIEPQLNTLESYKQDQDAILATMIERRRRSKDFFERYGRDWDTIHAELLDLPDYQAEMLALLPSGGVTLEVGVGSGALLPFLVKHADRVVGVDHSPAMITLARETVASQNLAERVDVRLAEMNHLPLVDGSARTVVVNQVLHHSDQPGEVLKEIARVLEPGGVLVLADLMRHDLDWAREHLADQWLGFKRTELEAWLAAADMSTGSYRELVGTRSSLGVFLLTAGLNEHKPSNDR